MKKQAIKKSLLFTFLFVLLPFLVQAEIIVFKSGNVIEADVVEITADKIKVDLMGAITSYDIDKVKSIDGEKISAVSGSFPVQKTPIQKEPSEKKPKGQVEKIERLLGQKRDDLKNKRQEYIQAKRKLKEAARTGFLGFGRTKEEKEELISAKEKVVAISKKYKEIKIEINELKRELKKAERKNRLENKKEPSDNPDKKIMQESFVEPEADLDKALKYFNIAVTHDSLGEEEKSSENYKKALKYKPDLGQYFYDRGVEEYYRRKKWEARRYLKKAEIIFTFEKKYQKVELTQDFLDKVNEQF